MFQEFRDDDTGGWDEYFTFSVPKHSPFRNDGTRISNKRWKHHKAELISGMSKGGYVYILTNSKNTVLYTGMCTNLRERMHQHKEKLTSGFASKYHCDKLLYFESHEDIETAILREKRIKKWKRQWKIDLVKSLNSQWNDLSEEAWDMD